MYPDDTDWPHIATTVLANIQRLQAIVSDLLTLTRLDVEVPLNRDHTDLAEFVGTELDGRIFTVGLVRNPTTRRVHQL